MAIPSGHTLQGKRRMNNRRATTRRPLLAKGAVPLRAAERTPYRYSDVAMLNVTLDGAPLPAHGDRTLPAVGETLRTDVHRETTDDQ